MIWDSPLYISCEHHWLIKELLWACIIAIGEQSWEGTKLDAGRKEAESGRNHGVHRRAETLLVGHDLVVVHRLMEMG